MNILFMCVANSGRSQIAEALARNTFGENARVESAGSNPSSVNPLTIRVLNEIGIDISSAKSKSFDDLSTHFIDNLDYVITLCSEEVCPILTSDRAKKLHWPLPDPAAATGGDDERLKAFRDIRDQIKTRVEQFASDVLLPIAVES